MPSTGIAPADRTVAIFVAKIAKEAFKNGLEVEWFQFFLGAMDGGEEAPSAAHLAATEWDF